MKYFFDTEFKEGFHKPFFGKNRHYIDLISIGIVAEDGRTYYAISNEFDLEEIWNSKDTWIKDNVLNPIHDELCKQQSGFAKTYFSGGFVPFTLSSMQNLIDWHGKANWQIKDEINEFIYAGEDVTFINGEGNKIVSNIEFYAYFADYDWVLFCSLFGRMLNLPKGFPMYCKDLKQIMDDTALDMSIQLCKEINSIVYPKVKHNVFAHQYENGDLKSRLSILKEHPSYPKQKNEHNALDDAMWNFNLFKFLTDAKK